MLTQASKHDLLHLIIIAFGIHLGIIEHLHPRLVPRRKFLHLIRARL
jgi:hypothetical protein